MRFLWNFLQNMLENGDSNLQTKFGVRVHITSNIFQIIQFKLDIAAVTDGVSCRL